MIIPTSIQHILEDNTSGSITLLKRIMIALENELLNPELEPATFVSHVELIRRRMAMFTVIRHFCDEMLLTHNISDQGFPGLYMDFIREYKDFWEHTPSMLMNNLVAAVPLKNRTIMVHSNSGTIREVFRLLADRELNIHFYQTLSAPGEEGRLQALDLASMGYKVTLIADTVAALKLRECDLLLFSADQVNARAIINKTGSMQMALAAQEFDVPVIVLTESRKSNKGAEESEIKDRDRDLQEILHGTQHPNITAENIYFEEVPRTLITHLITEKKRKTPGAE